MYWHPEALEAICCDLCGSSETHLIIFRPDGLQVRQCVHCGLCYVSPRPKPQFVERLYDESYFDKPVDSPVLGYAHYLGEENHKYLLRLCEIRLEIFKQFVPKMPNRCLEVGCATGEFCYLLSQLRCSAVGIDLSEQAIRVAQARYPGLDFRCGVLADLAPSARFDAIFGYEVIEHVLSPRQFLRTAANHLEQGGTLVLTTPNMDCGRTVGVERWMGFLLSFEHLYFFSPSTLHEYARQEGFELVAWLTGGGEGLLPQAPKRHSFRDLVKYGLDRLKLFGIAHEVWDLLKPSRPYQVEPKNDYTIGGQAHNLFVLLRKT